MIIHGRKLAKELTAQLKKEFKKFKKVKLAAVTVGENPASISFLEQKKRMADSVGVELKIYKFSPEISTEELAEELKKLSQAELITGIIIQLPLPQKFNLTEILKVLPPQKDVDALLSHSPVLAPTVEVVRFIFERYQINPTNKKILLTGYGRLVGKPIYRWLKDQVLARNIFVVGKDTPKKEKERLIKTADILVSGVGKANLIPESWVKPGAVVIDFGFDVKNGKIYGDVSPQASKKAKLFTPTPGGTGPILVAMIFKNLSRLVKKG